MGIKKGVRVFGFSRALHFDSMPRSLLIKILGTVEGLCGFCLMFNERGEMRGTDGRGESRGMHRLVQARLMGKGGGWEKPYA